MCVCVFTHTLLFGHDASSYGGYEQYGVVASSVARGGGGGGGGRGARGTREDNRLVRLPQVPSTVRQRAVPTERERIETEIIKSLMASYFNIVRKNFQDLVPKTIMAFLVNHAKENIQSCLVQTLYREGMFSDLLGELRTVVDE